MIDLEKKFSNLESELPYVLGTVYNRIKEGSHGHRFVEDMLKSFAEAHAQGAIFFGPIAVIPQNDRHSQWLIKDLRGGWGYNPIDLKIPTDPEVGPTLEVVCRELERYANGLRYKADCVKKLTDELCE